MPSKPKLDPYTLRWVYAQLTKRQQYECNRYFFGYASAIGEALVDLRARVAKVRKP